VSSEPLIELHDVHKHYRSMRALDGVSLSIMPGETLGVVGESGCGKSTIARLAVGLERPTRGELRFRGKAYSKSTRRLKSVRRQIGIVFQDPYESLDPRFTLRRIIDEPLRAHRLPHDRARIEELLTSVGMENAPLNSYAWSTPAASASGSESPERSRSSPSWSSAMSRPRRSTFRSRRRSSTYCSSSNASAG
jgi:ABC-type glutathione transport system ATPase component